MLSRWTDLATELPKLYPASGHLGELVRNVNSGSAALSEELPF